MEHNVGSFKSRLSTYKGIHTIPAIAKLSRATNHRNKIVANCYRSTKAFKRSGKHTENKAEYNKKVKALLAHLSRETFHPSDWSSF